MSFRNDINGIVSIVFSNSIETQIVKSIAKIILNSYVCVYMKRIKSIKVPLEFKTKACHYVRLFSVTVGW